MDTNQEKKPPTLLQLYELYEVDAEKVFSGQKERWVFVKWARNEEFILGRIWKDGCGFSIADIYGKRPTFFHHIDVCVDIINDVDVINKANELLYRLKLIEEVRLKLDEDIENLAKDYA